MRLRIVLLIIAGMLLAVLGSVPAAAGAKETEKVENAIDVLKAITAIPEQGIPPSLLRNAHGIAIIPSVVKVGFVVGGRYGTGVLVVRPKGKTWSDPSFVSLAGGSVGWQIGAQSTDIILVFKSKKSISGILSGKFTLGADASIAAGPVGRHAGAGTDVRLKAEIYSYSRSRGLFAGVALEGAALQIDDKANGRFYNKEYINPYEIFYKDSVETPVVATRFKKQLDTLSK